MASTKASTARPTADNDPCSATYRSSGVARPPSVRSKASTTRKGRPGRFRAFFRSVRRAFGGKSKKEPPFNMQNVQKKRGSKTSARNRPSSSRPTSRIRSVSTPTVHHTAETGGERRSHYRVHSYPGDGSLPPPERGTVRFSHPLVSTTIRPPTSSSEALLTVPENDEEDARSSKRNSAQTDDSVLSSDPPASQLGGNFQTVDPKSIYRWSAQSVAMDGSRESFHDFKGRLDGHKLRSDRDRPPSLQFIPRLGTIRLSESPAVPPAKSKADVDQHRSDALSTLEGSVPQPREGEGRYVLAILPRKDLPITAIQVPRGEVPSSLLPGGANGPTRPAMQRPHTFAAPTTTEHFYQAYDPPSSESEYASAEEKLSMESDSNDEMNLKPEAEPAVERKDRPKTPNFDVLAGPYFNSKHSQHYKRVESGLFESERDTPIQLPTPTSMQTPRNLPRDISESSFILTPSPKSSSTDEQETPAVKSDREKTKCMALSPFVPPHNDSKPLPSAPSVQFAPRGNPVSPLRMNQNGFPVMNQHPSKRFSAEARYKRRSLDAVEAKHQKENPKKPSKSEQVETKLEKSDAEEKKLKKSRAEIEKKRLAELNVLETKIARAATEQKALKKSKEELEKNRLNELNVLDRKMKKFML